MHDNSVYELLASNTFCVLTAKKSVYKNNKLIG